jgi:hypothetical protein
MEKQRIRSGARQLPAPSAPGQWKPRAGHAAPPLEEVRRQLGWDLVAASRKQGW